MASGRIAGTNRAINGNASTGRYVAKAATRHPRTSVTEGMSAKSGGGTSSRSAITGRYPKAAPAAQRPGTSVTKGEDRMGIKTAGGKGAVPAADGQAVRLKVQRAAGGKSRSLPADDPLAPERTRWLADVVGGGSRLAAMLGVSASQTSRWSSGQERPGVAVAPLLIDLEHVLARVRLVWADPAAGVWMSSANAYLDGARPIDVLQLSGPGLVLQALDAQAWGGAA